MLSRRGIVELYQTWHGAAGGRIGVRFGAHAADTCSPELLRAISTAAEKRGAGDPLASSAREALWRFTMGSAEVLVYNASARDVADVLIGGEHVVENGRPCRADVREVVRAAQTAAERVWRAGASDGELAVPVPRLRVR